MLKKVIVLSYFFPPSNAVGVHRTLRLGKALQDLGYHPIIVTSAHIMQGRKDENLVKLSEKYFKEIYYLDHYLDRWIANTIYNNRYGWWSKFARFFVENILIPEKNIFWGNKAYQFCERLIQQDKDIRFVWATMSPFTSGIVATKLTQKMNIPSLIDYRDPWMLSHYQKTNKWQRFINTRIEQRMLKGATAITVNTEPVKKLFLHHYPTLKKKLHVLNNGWYEAMQFIQPTSKNDEFIDMYYVGSFYKDRQPYTLLEGIKKLEQENKYHNLRLHFIGCSNPELIQLYTERLNLLTSIHYEGFVSYEEAMQYIQKANILLLINGTDAKNNIFIPAKLFDYLATRKQILFLGGGQASDILQATNAGITSTHQVEDIVLGLKEIIERSRHTEQYNEEMLKQYHATTLAEKMLKYIGEI